MVRMTFNVCRHRASVACTAVVMAAVGSNPKVRCRQLPCSAAEAGDQHD